MLQRLGNELIGYDMRIAFDLFEYTVFSAVSGLELLVSKHHHQCESLNFLKFVLFHAGIDCL